MSLNSAFAGQAMHAFIAQLYPICRSITGDGVRRTLGLIGREIPLSVHEVPTGTPVLDWTVPNEWNIRDASITDADGYRIVDFRNSNLHVLNYSVPVHALMAFEKLRPHLFSLPEHPDWIPYRTSYYKETWGFCVTERQLQRLASGPGPYEVRIDSTLEPGSLTYAEHFLPGETEDEVIVSCHICHPSLCNDNLSGIAVAVFLARELAARERHYSYRFLFLPGTIGAITWLARNRGRVHQVKHGLVMTCVGDAGGFSYKKSRRGDAEIDRAFAHVLRYSGLPYQMLDFSPYGYDERQYCSPGFNLPVGCLMRSVHGTFPEYHTSADDLDFVRPGKLAETFDLCLQVVDVLEANRRYRNLQPYGEVQLGRRGLYRPTGGDDIGIDNLAKLWILNQSDGEHSLLEIAERAGVPFPTIRESAGELLHCGLLEDAGPATPAEPSLSRPAKDAAG